MDKHIEFNEALGAGDILRRERLRQKLTLEDVSQKIHVNKHYLRDLEQNNLHLVLQDVYIIGFARSYAEFLGINGNDIVNQLKKDIKNVAVHDMIEVITPKRKFPIFSVGTGIVICIAILVAYISYHSFFMKKGIVSSSIKVTSHIPATNTTSHISDKNMTIVYLSNNQQTSH